MVIISYTVSRYEILHRCTLYFLSWETVLEQSHCRGFTVDAVLGEIFSWHSILLFVTGKSFKGLCY